MFVRRPMTLFRAYTTGKSNYVKDGFDLVVYLMETRQEKWLRLAMANQEAIRSVTQLCHLLRLFRVSPDLMTFATNMQSLVRNTDELVLVLNHLPENERLTFAVQNIDKINTSKERVAVLRVLPPVDGATFEMRYLQKKAECIRSHHLAKRPLSQIDYQDGAEFGVKADCIYRTKHRQ